MEGESPKEEGMVGSTAQGSARTELSTREWIRRNFGSRPIIETENLSFHYGKDCALCDVTLSIPLDGVTAIMGPSGCGKSTLLRVFNRMYELYHGARAEGKVTFLGQDLLKADPVALRRHIGMVFQRPNPFPKSIFENVAYGPRIHGVKRRAILRDIVEESLRRAALWDEVKDRLKESAFSLSGGQQQRLCIARALAVRPEVLLMDEPCSALDPKATAKIEETSRELAEELTVVIVTHNLQQAGRVSDHVAVLLAGGELAEFGPTKSVFENPADERVADYLNGRFG
jgi:phosphate transport system ATP-binding protein